MRHISDMIPGTARTIETPMPTDRCTYVLIPCAVAVDRLRLRDATADVGRQRRRSPTRRLLLDALPRAIVEVIVGGRRAALFVLPVLQLI